MSPFLEQFLTLLIVKMLNPKEDTKELQKEIIANPGSVEDIAIREATGVILKASGENTELVADVIEIAKTGSLKTVPDEHKGNLLTNLVEFIFGWWK